jgi:transporter family protein
MKAIIFALLTALFWGIAPLFEKLGLVKAQPITALTIRNIVIASSLILIITLSGQMTEIVTRDLKTIFFIILGGLLGGLLGMITYFYALKLGEASRVVPIVASYPLIAAILSIIFLGELLTLPKIIGAIFIVIGVWLVS